MKPYQYYIDDILGAVYSPETADPDFLRDSAAMYAEACAEVNDRLRSVARLLNRGLRSEAIQLAEQEPNLLETFGLLDFSELPAWRQMLVNWGMAEPPNLLVELASDLNRAYAEHQPIETLLRRHRLLALSRAPLSARIAHLHKLVTTDPNNDTWQNDLEALEIARIKQIDSELQTANRTGNLNQLTALYEETKNGDWSTPLPTGLAQKVETYYRKAAAIAARKELEKLDQQLNDSHMAFDVAQGQKVRSEWKRLLPVAMLTPDDPLLVQTQPAFAWLSETDRAYEKQQQFEATVANLERALEESADIDILRRLYNTALTFDEELPNVLKHRVEQCLAAHDLSAHRKRRLLLGAAVGVLVLAASGLTAWMVTQARAKAVAQTASTLEQFINKDDFPNATDYYAKLPEHLAQAPAVLALKSEMDSRVNAEKQRQADFKQALDIAQQSPREAPNPKALADAKKLAKSADESKSIASLEAEIAEASRQKQKLQNDGLLAKLKHLRIQLQAIELAKDSDDQRTARLKNLRKELEAQRQSYPEASSNILSQLSPLRTRIDALVVATDDRLRQAEWLRRLTDAVGDADNYWRVMNQFSAAFPNSPVAASMPTLKQERKLLDGLMAWSSFLDSSFTDKKYFTPEEAQTILKAGTDLQAVHADLPFSDYLEARRAYLESVVARNSDGSSKLEEVHRLLRDPLIANLYMVKRTSDGKAFYSREEPELTAGGAKLGFRFFTGFDLATKPRQFPLAEVAYQGEAPQSILAREIQTLVKAIPDRGWEESFCKALRSTADPSRKIDPILRMILLQRMLETATVGSTPLADGFKSFQQTLEEANVDLSVPWMAPDDELAITERNRADVLLSNLPPIDEAIQKTAMSYKELIRNPEVGFSWVGWLNQGPDGKWSCRAKNELPTDGRLIIIHPQPGSKQAVLSEIGTVQNGQVAIALALTPTQKVLGRPVFLQTAESPGN